jgi:NAD(P)-dependent dehydrogenase (short-subunit alcohol dehydrogenase family)
MTSARLDGLVAVVSGGASGIGAAIVSRFQREGARVHVFDLQAADGDRYHRVDVTDETQLEAAYAQVMTQDGRLDLCVANAGISPVHQDVVDQPLAAWQQVIDLNLTGAFLTLRGAARLMKRAGNGGRLLATGSVAGLAGERGFAAYCSSKFALRGLVESMALELAPDDITVNLVAPGEVDTPLHTRLREMLAAERGLTADQLRAEIHDWLPARRLATSEEIAGAFAYLASPEAAYVTGTVQVIDGGQLLV